MGHQIYYFAGELDPPGPNSSLLSVPLAGTRLIERAHFVHSSALWVTANAFGTTREHERLRFRMESSTAQLKRALQDFLGEFHIDVLVAENVFALPLNLPLSMALRRVIAETEIPTIAHNHDFYWERERFSPTSVDDILVSTFPPKLPSVRQVVINTQAQRALDERGFESALVPNVFDFARPASGPDDYNADLRSELGLSEGDLFFLQPTRVVRRKGIKMAIELVRRLADLSVKLIITHHAEFDTLDYLEEIQAVAARCHVDLRYLPVRFEPQRRPGEGVKKTYSLWDAYIHADFVTYPSLYEGFGNALLETLYFHKPMLVNRYAVYRDDIEPLGLEVVSIDGKITDESVWDVRQLLENPARVEAMTTRNAEVAEKHFSYEVLQRHLENLLASFL